MNKITRDINRRILSAKEEIKRLKFKILKSITQNNERKYIIQDKLDKLSRNSSKTRIKNYCIITNRSKGVYKDFKLSRIVFRELALKGELPGIRKASW